MNHGPSQLPDLFVEALERNKARWETSGEHRYVRLTDDLHGYPKGTVFIAGRMIPGFPHIGRIYRLEQGLRQQFRGSFHAEEKIDGYNARVFLLADQVLTLTRGGYLCPFTTDRIFDLLNPAIFDRHPDLILCAEIVGPDNPYAIGTPPFVDSDVSAYVFDMMRDGVSGFLRREEKSALAGEYDLPVPRYFGHFGAKDWPTLRDLIVQLDEDRREGMVFKEDRPQGHRTKYVTRNSGIYDIAVRSADVVELPGDFFTGRVLRMALFMDETGIESDADMHRRLGAALMEGLSESVEGFKREGRVAHRFRCRFRRKENAEAFMRHLRSILGHTHLWQRSLQPDGNYWLLEFDKEVPKLSGLFHQLFRGDSFVD